MRRKKIFYAMIPFFVAFFASCASAKFDGKAWFVGKIFDQNGNAVCGYEISAAGKKTVSGSDGIFYLENIKSGKILLEGQKNGYSNLKEKVDFLDRKKFFCIFVEKEIEKKEVWNEE